MSNLEKDMAAGILNNGIPPCFSLYQPTHRHRPENQQDQIRFGNLMKALEESALQRHPRSEIAPILDSFHALAKNHDFWNNTLDGLAVLASADIFRVYKLHRPVAEMAEVAESFHLKPLLRILQTADRYHVLGVSRTEIRLFEGNRDVLDEIEPPDGIPRTMVEALGAEITEPHQTVASYGGVGVGRSAMHHGHGGRETEVDLDTERFFRAVDRAVLEEYSQPSRLPMLLAALPEHHHLFQRVSHNPFLRREGIGFYPPDEPGNDTLRRRAWNLIEPLFHTRVAAMVEDYGSARSEGLANHNLHQVANAIREGRVARLLIEAQREIPGRINRAMGGIELGEAGDPQMGDLLDELGQEALAMGAEVVVLAANQMPSSSGLAAVYRH
ncbi:MAG: hypothetical protein KFB97_12855 [Cyanobium sp. M30B3]|nr:MAG: hypothetical protein KFB97_12855 [Cyanobium sp. M30B3]